MPFSIVRSSIASASAEAVFCPASARSELHRFILGPAGSAAGQKVRHLSGFPGSRSFITRLDHLRCLAACVAYPPSSAFPRSFRDAFQHLSEEEVQSILIPLEEESQLHPVVTLVRDFLLHEDESDVDITILIPNDLHALFSPSAAYGARADKTAFMPPPKAASFEDMDAMECFSESAVPCAEAPAPAPMRRIHPRQADEGEITKLVNDLRHASDAGESFHDMLFRLIDETDATDAEIYKRANISRQLFSKIRSNRHYQPGKNTVFAFALALHLTVEETERLLESAGFAFSPSSPTDRAVRMCMQKDIYDIGDVNELLFQLDLRGLGA